MWAITGSLIFSAVAILTILAAVGLPIGEFTMGGKNKVLPKKLKLAAFISFVIQVFAIIIILQAGEILPLWFSFEITRIICIFFAVYLSLNTILNLISKSKKERLVMTPLSFISAICFYATAFS